MLFNIILTMIITIFIVIVVVVVIDKFNLTILAVDEPFLFLRPVFGQVVNNNNNNIYNIILVRSCIHKKKTQYKKYREIIQFVFTIHPTYRSIAEHRINPAGLDLAITRYLFNLGIGTLDIISINTMNT